MGNYYVSAIVNALRQRLSPEQPQPTPSVDERAAQAQTGAQAIAKKLPAAVMPHAGLAEDKRRKAMIDRQMMEGNE